MTGTLAERACNSSNCACVCVYVYTCMFVTNTAIWKEWVGYYEYNYAVEGGSLLYLAIRIPSAYTCTQKSPAFYHDNTTQRYMFCVVQIYCATSLCESKGS